MRSMRIGLGLTVVASFLALANPVAAQEAHPTFVAEMTGFEEAPGVATLAKGFAGIQVSADGQSVFYTIVLTDSSSPIVAAHLHLAPRGEAGPVVVGLCSAQTTRCQTEGMVAQGSFDASDFSGPLAGDTLDRLIRETRNGMIYVNVHSTKYPSGEARGQLGDIGALQRQPEPALADES
jgi:hypothetical protein